jgi:deoxyribonuclease-2
MILTLLLSLYSLLYFTMSANALSCYSDAGKPVDWWFISKQPKGTRYVYYDTNTPAAKSPHDLNDTTSGALAHTIQQMWHSTNGYAIFNDEPIGQKYCLDCGHTKGAWIWDTQNGIIITHSIPLYPAGPSQTPKYLGFGPNAWEYGQHMACFTLTTDQLNSVAELGIRTAPKVYDSRIPESTPDFVKGFANGTTDPVKACDKISVTTQGGMKIVYFAKSAQWDNELYGACMAPQLQKSLAVESWIRGKAEGAWCNQTYTVVDVETVNMASTFQYKEADDHSKWAVATDGSLGCVGGINRMTTQYIRGGGSYCIKELGQLLLGSISSSNNC